MQSAVKKCVRVALAARVRPTMGPAMRTAPLTTYSGGQPSEGQGGFYGSAKTRSEDGSKFSPGSRAEPQDVSKLTELMQSWEAQKQSLASDEQAKALAQLAADESTTALIQRLVVRGAPVWGLTTQQREFVTECNKASS